VVFLGAGRTSVQVRAHTRDSALGILTCQLRLDVDIESFKALLTTDIGPLGAE
jgi:hypothetical protein